MNQDPHSNQDQNFEISDHSELSESQIAGQAGHDLVSAQNQGSGNIFQGVTFNLLGQSSPSSSNLLDRKAYRNRQALLYKVKHYWIQGILERSQAHHPLIPIRHHEDPSALVQPWSLSAQETFENPQPQAPNISPLSAIEIFDRSINCRNLLILGEPGSGKTITLISLAKILLERAEQDTEQALPVIFNLSSWNPQQTSLEDWLTHELTMKYQVPTQVGLSWIHEDRLLLLLDGLDEMQSRHRNRCIDQINRFRQEHCVGIIVTCRTNDYDILDNRFNFQNAIHLCPLDINQILTSLGNHQEQSPELLSILEQDCAFRDLAQNPLMLSLLLQALTVTASNPLDGSTPQDINHHYVLEFYSERMVSRLVATSQYSKAQVLQWLTSLATEMTKSSRSIFLIESLQPSCLKTPLLQILYWMGVKSLVVAPWGAMHVGLLTGQQGYDLMISSTRNLYGMAFGFLGGLIYGVLGGILAYTVTDKTNKFLGRCLNGLLLGSIYGPAFAWAHHGWTFGLAYAFIYSIVGFLIYDLLHADHAVESVENIRFSWRQSSKVSIWGILIGLAFYIGTPNDLLPSMAFGFMIAFTFGFENKDVVGMTAYPNQGLINSATNCARLFFTIGSLTSIVLATLIVVDAHQNPMQHADYTIYVILNGLYFGAFSSLIGGQGAGIICIKHLVLRILIYISQGGPWNYAKFLDQSANFLLLKKVGGGYVFVHRLLLEYFGSSGIAGVKN